MVRSIPAGSVSVVDGTPMTALSVGLFVSIVALVSLCAKHYHAKSSKKTDSGKLESEFIQPNIPAKLPARGGRHTVPYEPWDYEPDSKLAPRSPLASPKAFLATLSHKAVPIFQHAKRASDEPKTEFKAKEADEDDGVWKRKILMGERCQPPNFSGAIYYDHTGKRVPELPPKSPPGSIPLANFSFPIVTTQGSPQ